MESKSDDFNTWVVVMAAGGTFIGKPPNISKNELMDGRSFELNPAYQLQVHAMPIPAGPGQIQMRRELTCLPFFSTIRDAPLRVRPGVAQFMRDLHPGDVFRYKTLVNQATKLQKELQAQEAGIHLADKMPGSDGPAGSA